VKRFGLALLAIFLGGCLQRVPSRIFHPPTNPPLAFSGKHTLAVEIPADLRPMAERVGEEPKTALFVFLLFYIYIAERGNVVTNHVELGPQPAVDLGQLTLEYLRRARVFRDVVLAPQPADFLLRARVHHLFGARFMAQSASAAYGGDSGSASHFSAASHAPFGNAVVSYELVDRRGAKPRLVWRDTLAGFAVGDPAAPKYAPLPGVVQGAVSDLLTRLALELHLAFERLDGVESREVRPPVPMAPGFTFLVQRATDFLLPLYTSLETGKSFGEIVTADVNFKLAFKVASWVSLEYVLGVRRLPLLSEKVQVWNGLLASFDYTILQ
jgi:hypothetical protein